MIEVIWNSLLELKNILGSCDRKNFSVQVFYTGNSFHIQVGVAEDSQFPLIKFNFQDKKTPVHELSYTWDELFQLKPVSEVPQQSEFQFLNNYLSYCFCSLKAHKLGRAVGISHYAQSLDGKVATLQGHSKWISHQDDLVHCHRMRALCDAILIGMNTLRNDKPKLNVRHVKGNSPVRVVIGSSAASFSSLLQSKEKVIFFTTQPANILQGVDQIIIPRPTETPEFVMESLYKQGIHSVFIEGGSQTTSSFMEHKMLDEVQLYLAPVVFGSGLPNFSLPEIKNVEEAVSFSGYEFIPMGNGIMFKGTISSKYEPAIEHQQVRE